MLGKEINEDMKMAAAKAITSLAREDVPDEVVAAYGETDQNMAGTLY